MVKRVTVLHELVIVERIDLALDSDETKLLVDIGSSNIDPSRSVQRLHREGSPVQSESAVGPTARRLRVGGFYARFGTHNTRQQFGFVEHR